MSNERRTALALMIALGLFITTTAGVILGLYLMERHSGVLQTRTITALKDALKAKPDNPALLETIRQSDLQLRQAHFRDRSRFYWAGWMLLAAGVGWLASARWFMALGTKPLPIAPEGPPSDERPGRAAGVVALSGCALLAALFIAALFWSPDLPSGEVETASSIAANTGNAGSVASTETETPAPGESTVAPSPGSQSPALFALSLDDWKRNWPSFRGPDGIGVAAEGDWPTSWSLETKHNIVWSVELTISGKSSPVVWNDRVFATGGEDKHHVVCFDRADGRVLWDQSLDIPADFDPSAVEEYAGISAPSPVTDGRRVYALFASGLMAAFDFEGNPVWSRELGPFESMYGFAASPTFYAGTVILQCDQGTEPSEGLSRLIALNADTGETQWETPREVPNSWSSPALIRAPERVELVTCADPWAIAYDPATGEELWRIGGLTGDVAPSPAFGGGLIFIAQTGADLLAIRPGGTGDVAETNVLWKTWEGLPDMVSPVAGDKRLLMIDDGGGLTCFDIESGEKKWEAFLDTMATASPILAGGRAYIFCNDGSSVLVDLNSDTPDLKAIGAVGDPIEATPAFVDGRIYIRSEKRLTCVGEANS